MCLVEIEALPHMHMHTHAQDMYSHAHYMLQLSYMSGMISAWVENDSYIKFFMLYLSQDLPVRPHSLQQLHHLINYTTPYIILLNLAHNKSVNTNFFQVPLGVLLHNENKLDEMGYIMDIFMKLVPQQPDEAIAVLPNGDVLEFDNTQFSKILLGGDQLTAARAYVKPKVHLQIDNKG